MRVAAVALSQRSLVALARHQWDRAEILAGQARAVLRQAGIEDIHTTPLICAIQAGVALHRGDAPAAHQELINAQRLRHLLTYAHPYLAVQARIELTRVQLALTDLAGARTLMREIDDLLKRRPGLGTLVQEAEALRDRLAKEGVVPSVQLGCLEHRAILLIIRRSWVRAPPAPAFPTC